MNPFARHRARELALQALYQWIFSQNAILDIETTLLSTQNTKKLDVEYFRHLFEGVIKHIDLLDEQIVPYLDRKLRDLNPVELSILRMGMYELNYCLDVPSVVVINEAVELAKKFGAQDGHKYVNGVLDKAAKNLRKIEF